MAPPKAKAKKPAASGKSSAASAPLLEAEMTDNDGESSDCADEAPADYTIRGAAGSCGFTFVFVSFFFVL